MTTYWAERISTQASRAQASSIRSVVAKAMRRPDMIFFAGGEPDPDLFALDEIRAAYDAVLRDRERAAVALQYSSSEGMPALRDWVAERMVRAGVACRRDNVLITSGSQQGLGLMGRLFVDAATPVYVQSPTYSGAVQAFGAHGASFRSLPAGIRCCSAWPAR